MKLKNLQSNDFRVFITEDLTSTRQHIIRGLSKAKKVRRINSFWTNDGRIFYRIREGSNKILVKAYGDISHLVPPDEEES